MQLSTAPYYYNTYLLHFRHLINEANVPPVALAMRFKSSFLHLLTAIAPASTKYFKQRSSIPPVTSTTLAPADSIFSILSLVMSDSLYIYTIVFPYIQLVHYLFLISSNFSGSVTNT